MGWPWLGLQLLIVVVTGALAGAGLATTTFLAGQTDLSDQGGWGGYGIVVAGGAILGAFTGLAAGVGTIIAVAVAYRRWVRTGSPARATVVLSVGPGCGAAALWLGICIVYALVSETGAGLGFLIVVGVMAAPIAAGMSVLQLYPPRRRRPARAAAGEVR
ncbi:hypothetical protein [Agromyces rhizosphaerae]|nr:hypothetical protein [Agromyces rhizosphaerae]